MSKYKYYFRKPRSEIVKDIFYWLTVAGAVSIAATSPYFVPNAIKAYNNFKKYPKLKVSDTFSKLRRRGLIEIERKGAQIFIRLTAEGRKRAGIYQINNLSIRKPQKWDRKWRLVIFDIAELKKVHREAFRGKIKELGFLPIQRSVWIQPFPCGDEIALLRDFFGLDKKDVQIILAEKIENEENLKKAFNL